MDFPNESSLLSAIVRLRAIRKRRLEIRKEDAALEAEENAILEVGTSRPVTRKTLSGEAAAEDGVLPSVVGDGSQSQGRGEGCRRSRVPGPQGRQIHTDQQLLGQPQAESRYHGLPALHCPAYGGFPDAGSRSRYRGSSRPART